MVLADCNPLLLPLLLLRPIPPRLINQEDKEYFTRMLHEMLRSRFEVKEEYEAMFVEKTIMFGERERGGEGEREREREKKERERGRELTRCRGNSPCTPYGHMGPYVW